MAVQDLWIGRNGQPTDRHGRGRRYRVVVPGHPSKSFTTKRPAEMHEAKLLVSEPSAVIADATVGDLVDAWVLTKAHLSVKGLEAVTLAAAAVKGAWGSEVASQMTRTAAQQWISAEPGSPSRKHKLAQCLAGALSIGVERGVVDRNPAARLSLPPEEPSDQRYLTTEQVRVLADHANLPGRPGYYAPMVWLLVTTGLRVGEAINLQVGDVVQRRVGDRLAWRARVRRSKNGVARDVPLSAAVVEMLDLDRDPASPLLLGPSGGLVSLGNWRSRVWRPATVAAGLEGLVPHQLRHTAASWAIADGADVKAVQRMLGHKSAKMTLDLYGHLWDEGLDLVADRMTERLGG